MAWEFSRIDQVMISPITITPYLSLLALPSSYFLPLHTLSFFVPERLSPNDYRFFFFGSTDLDTHFGASSAVVIPEVEPQSAPLQNDYYS